MNMLLKANGVLMHRVFPLLLESGMLPVRIGALLGVSHGMLLLRKSLGWILIVRGGEFSWMS
jgi:hypothetical protein